MVCERKLTVVTTCTNLKRGDVADSMHLGSFAGKFYRDSIKAWVSALEKPRPTTLARDLYVGSHWQESMECEKAASSRGYATDLWVLSAGYGLISATESAAPYAASFAAGADSIQNLAWPVDYSNRRKALEWWELLHRYRGRESLRRFTGLAGTGNPLLFILSREYFSAVEAEIIDLISAGVNVLIVSAGLYRNVNSVAPVVRPHVLPFSDSFKQVDDYLNKTNVSLNARLATWLVRNHGDTLHGGIDAVHPMLLEIFDSLPAMNRKDVNRMSDDEVLAFIQRNYSEAYSSASTLLRLLRDVVGMSCEQKRFGSLFRKYQQSIQSDLFNHE
jgi:hypothetical protein